MPLDAPIAATVLLAAGRPEPAEAMLARGRQGPPTSAAAGTALLADGLAQSIAGSGAVAMNSLTRAMAMLSSSARSRNPAGHRTCRHGTAVPAFG